MTTSSTHLRRRASTSDKIWSVGLAGAACIGLVGVIGVKAAEVQAKKTADAAVSTSVEPVTSAGLTQSQLDSYAAQVVADRANLDQYRQQLLTLSQQIATLQQTAVATSGTTNNKPKLSAFSATKKTTLSVAPPPLKKPTIVKKPANTVSHTTTKSS